MSYGGNPLKHFRFIWTLLTDTHSFHSLPFFLIRNNLEHIYVDNEFQKYFILDFFIRKNLSRIFVKLFKEIMLEIEIVRRQLFSLSY
jgi:hypothetical protein